jgi:hypothetical protein
MYNGDVPRGGPLTLTPKIIMFRLRFHLAQGPHFMHWQVRGPNGVSYYKPDEVTIRAQNVTLKNSASTAKKIFEGADKTVCAWLQCEFLEVIPKQDFVIEKYTRLFFNPRNCIHWTNEEGWNLDNKFVGEIITIGRQVLANANFGNLDDSR